MVELDEWKTKEEAAQLLQVGVKTVERYAKADKIRREYRRIPGRRPLPVYNPEDIEKIRQENVPMTPAEPQPSQALTRKLDPAAFLSALLQNVQNGNGQPSKVRLSEKLYLTLNEAAEFTGLSKTLLRRKIHDGELTALRDGGFKIRREDLESL